MLDEKALEQWLTERVRYGTPGRRATFRLVLSKMQEFQQPDATAPEPAYLSDGGIRIPNDWLSTKGWD